jgi:hypothetical protein
MDALIPIHRTYTTIKVFERHGKSLPGFGIKYPIQCVLDWLVNSFLLYCFSHEMVRNRAIPFRKRMLCLSQE